MCKDIDLHAVEDAADVAIYERKAELKTETALPAGIFCGAGSRTPNWRRSIFGIPNE